MSSNQRMAVAIFKRWYYVVIATVLSTGLAVGYCAVSTKMYTATTSVQLMPAVSTNLLQIGNNTGTQATSVDVPTQIQVIMSKEVASLVHKKYPKAPAPAVAEVGTSNVVNISVTVRSPKKAAAIANAYASAYMIRQRALSLSALHSARAVVQAQVNVIQTHINDLQNQINHAPLNQQAVLQLRLNSLTASQTTLTQEIISYDLAVTLATGGGQVVSPAVPPRSPSTPRWVVDVSTAFVLGLAGSIFIILILDRIGEKIYTNEDAEAAFRPVPYLGAIPRIDDVNLDVHSIIQGTTAAAEAYRVLRTSFQFAANAREGNRFLFTSPEASEGKSTIASSVAIVLAEIGLNVILVDCDLRRPSVHKIFDLPNARGLIQVFSHPEELEMLLHESPLRPNLRILTSGFLSGNPAELFGTPATVEILDHLSSLADIVILDCSPVLPVSDPAVLAEHVSGVVLICRAGVTTRRTVRRALTNLSTVGAKLMGYVTNDLIYAAGYYRYYRYREYGKYGYTKDSSK